MSEAISNRFGPANTDGTAGRPSGATARMALVSSTSTKSDVIQAISARRSSQSGKSRNRNCAAWGARSRACRRVRDANARNNLDVPSAHTTCRPSGISRGLRQNASLTKRLNRSGGSNVVRGSALTVPRTVCSPGVPARSSNSVTS